MSKFRFPIALVFALSALAGCTDALVYGESSGVNLAITVDPAKSQPLEVNFGAKRSVIGIVPPVDKNEDTDKPAGEAVSMFSHFSLNYEENESDPFRGKLRVRSAFASGMAARAIPDNADVDVLVKNLVGDRIEKTISTADPAYTEKAAPICNQYAASQNDARWQDVSAKVGFTIPQMCDFRAGNVDFAKLTQTISDAGL